MKLAPLSVRGPPRAVSVALLAVPVVVFAWLGGARTEALIAGHVLVAAAAIVFAVSARRRPSLPGASVQVALAGLVVGIALAMGQLLLPGGVLTWVAPGIVEARGPGWHSLSLEPAATVGSLAMWALGWGYLVLASAWSERERRLVAVETVVVAFGLVFGLFALAHAWSGADAVLGVLAPRHAAPVLLAPLVNPNHAGVVAVAGLAVAVWRLVRRLGYSELDVLAAASALVLAVVVVVSGSIGAWGSLVVVAVTGLAWARSGRLAAAALLGTGGVAGVTGFVVASLVRNVTWDVESFTVRTRQWADVVPMIADFPVAGAGGGAFASAYRPYCTLPGGSWSHAHSDPLQWVAETGAIGLIAGAVALVLLGRLAWRARPGAGPARGLWLGVLAVLLQAVFDFPLHLPGVALGVAGVAGVLLASGVRRRIGVRTGQVLLLGVAALQVPAVAWTARTWMEEQADRDVPLVRQETAAAARAVATLRWVAPWSGTLAVGQAWLAEQAGDRTAALARAREAIDGHWHDPDVLRPCALVLARAEQTDDALRAALRAGDRAPADYRGYATVSLVRGLRGDEDGALTAWAEALKRWPPNVDGAPLDRALALMPQGLYWVEALQDAHPTWSIRLGHRMLAAGDPATALLAFEQARERLNKERRDLPAYGRALALSGQPARAQLSLEDLVDEEPTSAIAWTELARVRAGRGDHAGARDAFTRAADNGAVHLWVSAIQEQEAAEGVAAALELAREIEFRGVLGDDVQLEVARLQLAADDPNACLRTLEHRLFAAEPLARRADALREACLERCPGCRP